MSTWKPDLEIPSPIRYRCNNGGVVTAGYYKRVASAINHCVAYRRKTICSYSENPNELDAGVSATVVGWFAYFHSGHGVDKIEIKLTYAVCDAAGATAPYLGAEVITVGGSTATADGIYTGLIDASTVDAAGTLRTFTAYLDCGSDADCIVYAASYGYARIQAVEAHELGAVPVDDTGACGVDPRVSIGGQITGTRQGAFGQAVDELLRSNRAQLISWSVHDMSNPKSFASTTYTNVLDGASTSVAASTPGWFLKTRYHNTVSRTTVPVKMAVQAECTAGTSGKVKLTDGTNEVEITGITSLDWYTTTSTIPATTSPVKWDAMAAGTGAGDELDVISVCLFEYE